LAPLCKPPRTRQTDDTRTRNDQFLS
jgi:hypothetical protein